MLPLFIPSLAWFTCRLVGGSSPRLQIDLQGVQIARHHIPKRNGAGEVHEVLLTNAIFYLVEERVIHLSLERQVLGVFDDALIVLTKKRTGLVRPYAIDLGAGNARPFGDGNMADKSIIAV